MRFPPSAGLDRFETLKGEADPRVIASREAPVAGSHTVSMGRRYAVMNDRKPSPWAAAVAITLVAAGCGDGSSSPERSPEDRIVINPDGSERLVVEDRPVDIVGKRRGTDGKAPVYVPGAGAAIEIRLVATLAPPIVGTSTTQATSVAIDGSRIYVGYGLAGAEHRGALDVIDISSPTVPAMMSSATFVDADVNAVAATADAVYLGLATEGLGYPTPAAIERLEAPTGVLDPSTSQTAHLGSFAATAVCPTSTVVLATSGDTGGVRAFDAEGLAPVASLDLADARWVTANPTSALVLQADPPRLVEYTLPSFSHYRDIALPSAADAEAKATVVRSGDVALVTAGRHGLHVVDLSTGVVIQTIAPPAADTEAHTNMVAVSGDLAFVANGYQGVTVLKAASEIGSTTSNNDLIELGDLALDTGDSPNHIVATSTHLVVASGRGGVRVLSLEVVRRPTAPSNLVATSSTLAITLSWIDHATDESGFVVERAVDGGSFVEHAETSADVTSFVDTAVTATATYDYRLRSAWGAVRSEPSNTVTSRLAPDLSIASFMLIDADADVAIGPLEDGDVITLSDHVNDHFSVEVLVSGPVESVRIQLNAANRVENIVPYSMTGDNRGDFNRWRPPVGTHTLTATPYSRDKAEGDAGSSLSVEFSVVE